MDILDRLRGRCDGEPEIVRLHGMILGNSGSCETSAPTVQARSADGMNSDRHLVIMVSQ